MLSKFTQGHDLEPGEVKHFLLKGSRLFLEIFTGFGNKFIGWEQQDISLFSF